MRLTGLPAAVNSIPMASSSTVVVVSTSAAAVGAIDVLPSDLRNHLIDMRHEFDRPDRRSREPSAHIRQYYRARAIGVIDCMRDIQIEPEFACVLLNVRDRLTTPSDPSPRFLRSTDESLRHQAQIGSRAMTRSQNRGGCMNMFHRLALSSTVALALVSVSFGHHYTQTNLQANAPGLAEASDPQLVNAWGLSRASGSPWWVSDNATGVATLYNGPGTKQSLVVTIPPASPNNPKTPTGSPTGMIANSNTTDFPLAPGKPADF